MILSKIVAQIPKIFLFFSLSVIFTRSLSQSVAEKKNSISISIPFVYNYTTIYNTSGYYREVSGSGIGSGLRLNYDRVISNKVYLKVGAGIFIQAFGIQRLYTNITPQDTGMPTTDLGKTTKYYKYACFELIFGGGYLHRINEKNNLDIGLTYNPLFSFSQTYISTKKFNPPTVTNNHYLFAHNINGTITLNKQINSKLIFQYGFIVPLMTRWRKDDRFFENKSEFYKPKFHLGVTLGMKYNF